MINDGKRRLSRIFYSWTQRCWSVQVSAIAHSLIKARKKQNCDFNLNYVPPLLRTGCFAVVKYCVFERHNELRCYRAPGPASLFLQLFIGIRCPHISHSTLCLLEVVSPVMSATFGSPEVVAIGSVSYLLCFSFFFIYADLKEMCLLSACSLCSLQI